MTAFSTIFAIVSTAFSVISAKMQKDRAKKAAKNAADDANRASSLEVVVEATVLALAIPYGRCKIGGIRTLAVVPPTSLAWILFFQSYGRTAWGNTILDAYKGLISNAVDYTAPTTARNAVTFSNTTLVHNNSKVSSRDRYKYQNEVLITQQAICQGGINQILYAMVDQKPWETVQGVHINAYCDGGVVDPLIAQQGYVNNLFINTAYATGAFLLDREKAQFGGAPELQFLIEGLMVYFVEPNENYAGGYKLSDQKSYSNNPALCLLDYLTNTLYGLGVSPDSINLASFFNAMILCEYVVVTDAPKNGLFWAKTPAPRHIKRFECNIALSSESSIRDNIIKILESMDMCDLIWSSGQYKLQLKYPVEWLDSAVYADKQVVQYFTGDSVDLYRSIVAGNTGIQPVAQGNLNSAWWAKDVVAAYITDDYIMRGKEITYAFPNAQTRYNLVTVKFRNESKEFAEDTVSWPEIGSYEYTAYLNYDDGVVLETEINEEAITDYWHAIAKAEQRCRSSRAQNVLKISISNEFSYLEPGDIFHVTSTIMKMPGRLFLVSSVIVQSDNTLDVEAYSYDARMLAWNALNEVWIPPIDLIATPLAQAVNVSFGNNTLSWGSPDDDRVTAFGINYTVTPQGLVSSDTSWFSLGATSRTSFNIPSTLAPGTYTFAIVSNSASGAASLQSGWPLATGVVTSDYAPPLAEPTYLETIVYSLTSTSTPPAKPVGGVYNFSQMALSVVPMGWYVTMPPGTGVGEETMWQSIGTVEYFPGDATVSMTDQWQVPSSIDVSGVQAILTPDTVQVMQDINGVNFNYSGAVGTFQVFVDGVEKTKTNEVVYAVNYTTNCTVTLNNVTGVDKGKFAVVLLEGDIGSASLIATINGNNYIRELTITAFNEGYIIDLSNPPVPFDVVPIMGFNHLQIDLWDALDYTEGNGHAKTNVFYSRVPIGDPIPAFTTNTILLGEFEGYTSPQYVFDDYEEPSGLTWQEFDYYLWISYTTKDGITGDRTDPILVNFNKIRTSFIEPNAITKPVSAESFSSMAALELPSTDFGGASTLITVNASGLLVNTTGESADMELRLNGTLIHTIPMLVGTQEIGSIPMASGSFTYIDAPGSGEHIYKLTVVGLDSILHQSISVVGLKR